MWLRRYVDAVLGLALLFALISGLAHSGERYFYCEAMGMLQWDPCQQGFSDDEDARDPVDEIKSGDCCELGRFPSLPHASTTSTPGVNPPRLVAIFATPDLRSSGCAHVLRQSSNSPMRWPVPPPRAATLRRAELMVFLT